MLKIPTVPLFLKTKKRAAGLQSGTPGKAGTLIGNGTSNGCYWKEAVREREEAIEDYGRQQLHLTRSIRF